MAKLVEQEGNTTELRSSVTEKAQVVAQLQRFLAEKEKYYAQLQSSVAEKEWIITQLQRSLPASSYICQVSGPGLQPATANYPTHVIVELSDASGHSDRMSLLSCSQWVNHH